MKKRFYDQMVLHVPHASTFIPPLYRRLAPPIGGSMPDLTQQIKEHSFYLVDYYTDELFVPSEEQKQIHSLIFDWNRILCDVERLPHDPLESRNCGIYSYRPIGDVYGGRKWLSSMKRYVEHQNDLAKLVTSVSLKAWCNMQTVLLIDCHSFSMHSSQLCPNPPSDIDICLGYNEDHTKPENQFLNLVEKYFTTRGYRVARNKPFANSKTVPVPVEYHSLMIEVNKSLYMNEETLEKTEGFVKLQKDIQEMYTLILK